MSDSIRLILSHYGVLLLCVLAFWGAGRTLMARLPASAGDNPWLRESLAITLGLTLFVVGLQALGIAGLLVRPAVLALLATGWLLAARECQRRWRAGPQLTPTHAPVPMPDTAHGWLWGMAPWLVAIPTLMRPLLPPAAFDELMYHLPQARDWALQGNISASEWLRYPWFPYNFDLLYSAALLLRNDVFTHLFHALAGWLVAALVYGAGRTWLGRPAAGMASAIWLHLTRYDYGTAYIDMGLALFVFAATLAAWQWWSGRGASWLYMGALLAGTAAGIKLQALFFLLPLAVALLMRERKPGRLATVLALFLLPCMFWYLRAWWTTGDPVNPLGARVFGFSNWTEADLQHQFDDLRSVAAWPSAWVWAAPLALLIPALRRQPAVRALLVWACPAALLWALSSAYPRYLMPAVPVAALLTAACLQFAMGRMRQSWRDVLPRARTTGLGVITGTVLLTSYFWDTSYPEFRQLRSMLPTTAVQRVEYLNPRVQCLGLLAGLHRHEGQRIFQVYLNGSLYYGPHPMWGDSLGPWAYRNYLPLDAADLHQKLAQEGFEILAVARGYVEGLESKPGFTGLFPLLFESDGCRAYGVPRKAPP